MVRGSTRSGEDPEMPGLKLMASTPAPTDLCAMPPHAVPIAAVLETFDADVERGLSRARAAVLRGRYGPNQLAEAPPVPPWKRFLAQFQELVIGILIVAAVISGA